MIVSSEKSKALRVAVMDDHQVVREGLVALMALAPDIQVVAQANSVTQSLSLLETLNADVVLVDLAFADGSGLQIVREIVMKGFPVKALMLSSFADRHDVYECMKAGARGYLLKECSSDELFQAIRAVHAGDEWLSDSISFHAEENKVQNGISTRELTVIKMISEGMSNEDISVGLCLSLSTVKTHVHHAMTKLQAKSRVELVANARKKGLIR